MFSKDEKTVTNGKNRGIGVGSRHIDLPDTAFISLISEMRFWENICCVCLYVFACHLDASTIFPQKKSIGTNILRFYLKPQTQYFMKLLRLQNVFIRCVVSLHQKKNVLSTLRLLTVAIAHRISY